MIVTATRVVRDEGTIVVFAGTDAQGDARRFGVDHRLAWDLADRIADEGEVACHVESWQVL